MLSQCCRWLESCRSSRRGELRCCCPCPIIKQRSIQWFTQIREPKQTLAERCRSICNYWQPICRRGCLQMLCTTAEECFAVSNTVCAWLINTAAGDIGASRICVCLRTSWMICAGCVETSVGADEKRSKFLDLPDPNHDIHKSDHGVALNAELTGSP